jgi:hypothetical protein
MRLNKGFGLTLPGLEANAVTGPGGSISSKVGHEQFKKASDESISLRKVRISKNIVFLGFQHFWTVIIV